MPTMFNQYLMSAQRPASTIYKNIPPVDEQHYDGPTLDSDVGPTIRTPEDQRRPNVVLLSGFVAPWNLHLYFSIFQEFGSTYFCKMHGTVREKES
jgi:hypothetical protein